MWTLVTKTLTGGWVFILTLQHFYKSNWGGRELAYCRKRIRVGSRKLLVCALSFSRFTEVSHSPENLKKEPILRGYVNLPIL